MFKNQKGISIILVMVSVAVLGGVTLMFFRLTDTMKFQKQSLSKTDVRELQRSIEMILSNENFCRISLAGNGNSGNPNPPVTFKKKNIDNLDNEGLDISLFLSNQAGNHRTIKKFNGTNNPGSGPDGNKSEYNDLRIKSIKLIMNNPTSPGPNYSNDPLHVDTGTLRVIVENKVSLAQSSETTLDFEINVSMSTGQTPDEDGETRILSCQLTSKPIPSSDIIEVGRRPSTCQATSGNFTVMLSKPFMNPPQIIITPQWNRFNTDNEDTTWWVTNVTTTSFTANYEVPGSGNCNGENFVYWMAIEKN